MCLIANGYKNFIPNRCYCLLDFLPDHCYRKTKNTLQAQNQLWFSKELTSIHKMSKLSEVSQL